MNTTKPRARLLSPRQVMLEGKRRRAMCIELDGQIMLLHPDKDATFASDLVDKINSGEVTLEVRKIDEVPSC